MRSAVLTSVLLPLMIVPIDAAIATNSYGTARITEALLPALLKAGAAGGARVVNVCSQAGRLGQVSAELQVMLMPAPLSCDHLSTNVAGQGPRPTRRRSPWQY